MSNLRGWWKPDVAEVPKKKKSKKRVKSLGIDRRWMRLRAKVLDHYGAACMRCGAVRPNAKIHVDHIKPKSIYPELRYVFSNLQVLCEPCNQWKGVATIDFRVPNRAHIEFAQLTREQMSHMQEMLAP